MDLEQFRKKRVMRYQKKMSRYLMYVFNDHFVLVLLFALGGLGYAYSEYLKRQANIPVLLTIAVCAMLALCLFPGRTATLLEAADAIFLTPLGNQMESYIKKMNTRSYVLPFLFLMAMVFSVMPLFVTGQFIQFKDAYGFVAIVWILKSVEMDFALLTATVALKNSRKRAVLIFKTLFFIVSLLLILLAVFVSPLLTLAVTFLICMPAKVYLTKKRKENRFDVEWLIEEEKNRQFFLYRLINLFTDVPYVRSAIKRKRWLDHLLQPFYTRTVNPFDLLYLKAFTRNSSFHSLFFRLLIIGSLIQAFSPLKWLNVLFAVFFLYLIGFQLLPIYRHYDGSTFATMYPVPDEDRKKAVQKLILLLLIPSSFSFFACSLLTLKGIDAALLLLIELAFTAFFTASYLPKRIKKG